MKKSIRRVLALGLALTLGLAPAASASEALGSEVHKYTVPLAPGTDMVGQSLWSATYADLRTEHYLTYTPTDGVRPALVYGEKLTTRASLSEMAKQLEQQGKRVVGGLNGDYYVVATGAPLGMVMTEGVLRSTPEYSDSWGLGFLADGTALIGQPGITVTARFHGVESRVAGGINKARTVQGGYVLLTDEFAGTTLNTQAGVDVVLRPLSENLGQTVEVVRTVTEPQSASGEDEPAEAARIDSTDPAEPTGEGQQGESDPPVTGEAGPSRPVVKEVRTTLTRSEELRIGSRVTCEVLEVVHTDKGLVIPEGCFVLTINGRGDPALVGRLESLAAGDRVEFDIEAADARWNQVETALGGMYKLVTAGAVEAGLDKTQAPRSAVGIKADGSAVFYTIDGRQSGYSVGASLSQVAQRLVELGCVEAVCLDGGGSTTFGVAWPGSEGLSVINRPSDGKARANSNALFLVSQLEPTGKLDHFYITPVNNVLLAGSSLQLTAHAMDSSYLPLEWNVEPDWAIHNGDGMVTTDGLFTAGGEKTVTQVTASFQQISGTVSITVVKTPDKVSLVNQATGAAVTALMLEPNQSVDLKGVSVYRNLPVTSDDTSYVWTADPAVGTVDENGVFTAAPASGSGTLTVSAGEKSLTIPVTVTGHILPLEDFEESVANLLGTASAQVEGESNLTRVRFGRRSAKVSYDAAAGRAVVGATLPIRVGERFLSVWVYGDGSANELSVSVADGEEVLTEVPMGNLDFTGWKQMTAQLPAGTAALRGFSIARSGKETAGVVWLDQLTTANERVQDYEAPSIALTVGGGTLSATVTDAMDKDLLEKNLSVTLDGVEIPFTWNKSAAKLTATVPTGDGKFHQAAVTAVDASGNRARASYSFTDLGQWEEPFVDLNGHWAQSYTAYLFQQGVINGTQVGEETFFYPDQPIRRGEMAVMVARWQRLDLDAYAEVELPFADLNEIPDWMLPAVRAMYAEGIMGGSRAGDALYANAMKEISRAEAMTLLGRLLDKGYAAGELSFSDADRVPDWALEYVQTLVGLGVVGGFDNKVNPDATVTRAEVAKMLVALT